MKKSSRIALICTAILCLTFILEACNKTPAVQDEEQDITPAIQDEVQDVAPAIPDGYQTFDNGAISFAYPEGFINSDASIVLLVDGAGSGNNITVAYEVKTGIYANMTKESYIETYSALYTAMGMDVQIKEYEFLTNKNNLSIIKIVQDTISMGIKMTQTQYITDTEDLTYIVTVTEVIPDAELVQNVFDSLNVVK